MTNESNEEIERKYTDLFNKLDRGADGELMWRLFTIVMCIKLKYLHFQVESILAT